MEDSAGRRLRRRAIRDNGRHDVTVAARISSVSRRGKRQRVRERKAGLGADIGMLSAAAALCSVAHHLGRALVTGYPISFISPSSSDMIGVALFLAMFAPVAVPRYYYCWVALGELDRWYGSPEGRERKPGWLNEQYSGLWAVFGFMLLVVSPSAGSGSCRIGLSYLITIFTPR